MTTTLYLTDEDADIQPASGVYKRLKLDARSDAASLVRSVTTSVAGPTAGIQITRTAGGTALAWITDPLAGTDLGSSGNVEFHLWASESLAAANGALRYQIYRFTNAEAGSAILDHNPGTELGTLIADSAASVAAVAQAMNDGDRLVLKVLVDDATALSLAAGTVTVSYNGLYARSEGDSYVLMPDTLSITAEVPYATRTRIRQILKDTSYDNPLLEDKELDRALDVALAIYSRDRPRIVTATMSGTGSAADFVLPRFWSWGYSRILELEYPTGETPRRIMETQDYELIESLLGVQPYRQLHFPITVPESGTDNIVLRYTARHVHTDETNTVPSGDFDALCTLAAAQAALTLAAKMAASSDPTIAADSVNHRDGEQRWRSVSKALADVYEALMGTGGAAGDSSNVGPAMTTLDWDVNLVGGADRLFHTRRWR